MSSRQSAGSGSRPSSDSRLPAIDLIGASELFSSWPMTRIRRRHASRSCSRSGWLRSESASRSCGEPPWKKRVRRTSHRPAPPAKRQVLQRGRRLQRALQPQRLGRAADQIGVGEPQQPAAVAVHQHQPLLAVEREDRDVDFGHHGVQERRGFLRAQALAAERVGQRVDLEHHVLERIGAAAGAGTDGEVAFAQRREQIRDGLQRPRDMASRQHGATPIQIAATAMPAATRGRLPATAPRAGRAVASTTAGRSAGQRQRQHAAVVAEHRHGLQD